MRILVVEDDREAAAYLTRGLKESGHIVDHAPDGQDGLHLRSGKPALRVDERQRHLPIQRDVEGLPELQPGRSAVEHQ
jgi:two-component system OmpR family response regulator